MRREQTEDVLVIWLCHREHCLADVLRRSLLFPPRIWLKTAANKKRSRKSLRDKHASTRPDVVSVRSIRLSFSPCVFWLSNPSFFALGSSPVLCLSSSHQSLQGVIWGGIKPLSAGPEGSLPRGDVAIQNTLRRTRALRLVHKNICIHHHTSSNGDIQSVWFPPSARTKQVALSATLRALQANWSESPRRLYR